MTAYGRFRKAQRIPTFVNGVASRKQARQAVLKRIRQQRAIILKRRTAKGGR